MIIQQSFWNAKTIEYDKIFYWPTFCYKMSTDLEKNIFDVLLEEKKTNEDSEVSDLIKNTLNFNENKKTSNDLDMVETEEETEKKNKLNSKIIGNTTINKERATPKFFKGELHLHQRICLQWMVNL
jgi:hypothetical protein